MTQCEKILAYMQQFGSITPLEAVADLGCMRLAARIADLNDAGHAIGRRMKTSQNRFGQNVTYAEYYLEESE